MGERLYEMRTRKVTASGDGRIVMTFPAKVGETAELRPGREYRIYVVDGGGVRIEPVAVAKKKKM